MREADLPPLAFPLGRAVDPSLGALDVAVLGVRITIREMDRHDPVIGVVAFVPTFLDSSTIIGALPSESVTTPSHVPNLK